MVHDGRTGEHGVPAATALSIVVECECETVGRLNGASTEFQPRDARAEWTREVDRVIGAREDIEVEAGDSGVDEHSTRRASISVQCTVVATGMFEEGAQLCTRDAHRAQRVVVRINAGQLREGDRTRVKFRVE